MKVLVIIDAQNDFISGSLINSQAMVRVNNIVKLINEFDGDDIILTQDTHYDESYFLMPNYLDTLEGEKLPIPHCIANTEGWQINRKIVAAVDEKHKTGCRIHFIQKSTFGSYDELIETLQLFEDYSEIEKITFCGFCTDICVISNVLITKAAFSETPIEVIENCCAGSTPEKHEAALQVMESCHIDITKEDK